MSLRLDVTDRGIATLTLDRPDAGNRYDPPMLAELDRQLTAIEDHPTIRVLVLRGAGKHFCVGADIGWHATAGKGSSATQDPSALPRPLPLVLQALDRLSKPTIAVVQGGAIGGGAALAVCCDIVIAETSAFFAVPEVRIGLPPSALLPLFMRAIGARHLRRYALTGERFGAAEAQAMGLVHVVTNGPSVDATLANIVDALLHGGPQAQATTKASLTRLASPEFSDELAVQLEADMALMRAAPEGCEGLAAFLEKRPPAWYRPPQESA